MLCNVIIKINLLAIEGISLIIEHHNSYHWVTHAHVQCHAPLQQLRWNEYLLGEAVALATVWYCWNDCPLIALEMW